jgi:hypothetical protein
MKWHNEAYGKGNWTTKQSFYWDEQKGDLKP